MAQKSMHSCLPLICSACIRMPPDCLNRRFGPGPPIFGLPQSAVRTKGYTSPLIGLPQSAVRSKGLLTSPLIGLPQSAVRTKGLLIFSSLALTAQSHHHRVISSCMHCITPLLTVLHFCQHFIAASMPTIIWHVACTILTLMWHCSYMSAHIPTSIHSASFHFHFSFPSVPQVGTLLPKSFISCFSSVPHSSAGILPPIVTIILKKKSTQQ
jgi:hypothetical protein